MIPGFFVVGYTYREKRQRQKMFFFFFFGDEKRDGKRG